MITGKAPRGITLRIEKSFAMDTSLGESFPMRYASTMVVPDSGRFTWHVNPSVRPSQYASAHLDERWTITCGPGNSGARRTQQVLVRRGHSARVDLSRCPAGPRRRPAGLGRG